MAHELDTISLCARSLAIRVEATFLDDQMNHLREECLALKRASLTLGDDTPDVVTHVLAKLEKAVRPTAHFSCTSCGFPISDLDELVTHQGQEHCGACHRQVLACQGTA